MGIKTFGLLGGLALGCCFLGLVISDEAPEAVRFIHDTVKTSLKSPATAQFPDTDLDTLKYDEKAEAYTLRSFVDAQNGFGALIRTKYTCTVESPGVTGLREWRVVNCYTDDELEAEVRQVLENMAKRMKRTRK